MKKFTLALLLIALRVSAQDSSAVVAAVDKAAAEDRFSGVVTLAKDGQPVVTKAWGYADPSKTTPNRTDTKFNLGSINKFFTKVAIGQLAAAGKLTLSDTIGKHLPDYPSPAAGKITIEQLIEHRSGLGDIFGPRFMTAHAKLRTLADYEQLFANEPLLFEPGAQQKYSNAGYVVLGLIVEKVSGQSYYDYVRDHITKPLGMSDTASYAVDENVPNRAIGLTKRGPDGPLPERRANTNTLPGRGSSAGGGYSTAADLLRFANALAAGKLLPERWTNWVFTNDFDGKARNLGIAGGSPGVNALVELEPPYTLIVLSNFDPPSAEQIGQAVRPLLGVAPMRRVRAGAPEPPGEIMIGGPTEVPMELAGHVPVIQAKVNGKGPFRFALDTGFAGVMMVSAGVAKQLDLKVVGEVMAGDPSGKNPRSVQQAHVDSFDVGNVHLGDFLAGEEADGPLDTDGVIGLQMFHSLLVTLDYPHKKVAITGGSLPANDAHVLKYNTEKGIPNVSVDVAGTKVSVDIDAGSPALLSLPLSVAKSLPLDGEPRVVGHGRTMTNEFDVYAATLKGEAHVGNVTLTNPQLDFVDIFPVGNIGSRFLSQYVVTFDPANQLVRFSK